MANEVVVKVGGSLYDLPDLGRRLRSWLNALPSRRILLIPGGGAAADLVRQGDALDKLGEECCHWLALRALQFTAHLLAARLEFSQVIEEIEHREIAWQLNRIPILDMHAFALADEGRPDHLAHRWDVTSDSLAARAAVVAGIDQLILLKSCDMPACCDWGEAARCGIVDATLPEVLAGIGRRLNVALVNLRQTP
jgi:5-(aminomethyl)-3-furanmethanol phosphate kinase